MAAAHQPLNSKTFDPMHEDQIHDISMDYYGKRLATCSSDRVIKIFDIVDAGGAEERQQLLAEIRGHEGPVWQVAWAHPKFGSIIASCSYDRRVIVWKESQPNQWGKIYEYQHESSVNSLAWAPHEFGLILAAASSDSTISVITHIPESGQWDLTKFQAHNIGCNSVSWAPAAAMGALVNPQPAPPVKRLASGGCDNMVKIWRYAEQEKRWTLEEQLDGHSDWVRDVAWAPNIGLPYNTLASCSQDNSVLVWTQDDRNPAWQKRVLQKFTAVVWRLSWSLVGHILAVSCGDGRVTLWKEGPDGDFKLVNQVGDGSAVSTGPAASM